MPARKKTETITPSMTIDELTNHLDKKARDQMLAMLNEVAEAAEVITKKYGVGHRTHEICALVSTNPISIPAQQSPIVKDIVKTLIQKIANS